MGKNHGRTSPKSLTTTRGTSIVAMCERKKDSLVRTSFLAEYQGSTLGFMEFITEDELQEHAGETARRICISKGPRHQIIKQGAQARFYGEKSLKNYGRTRKFIHGGMNLRTTTAGNEHVPGIKQLSVM